MRLADFLEESREEVMKVAASFAKTLPTLANSSEETLRDHFSECLDTIVSDLRLSQSRTQSIAKSRGEVEGGGSATPAQQHGLARAQSGMSVSELVSEYRALRSSILRLWAEAHKADEFVVEDTMRFNEAIDQAVAESTVRFEQEVEHWRHIFLGVVGHDLRTPLNAIGLTSEVLKRQAPEHLRGYVDVISKGIKRIGGMLDSLLEYSNSRVGEAMPLKISKSDLSASLMEEIEINRAAFPGNKIAFNSPDDLIGQVDISRVREAMSNLIANAAQHGTSREINVNVSKTNHGFLIAIRNNGEIPEEKKEGIFEPLKRGGAFQTGHRTNLGLGLFICKQIANAHGGDVNLKSKNGIVLFSLSFANM